MKTKISYLIILVVSVLSACQKDEPTEVVIKGALARIKKGGMVFTEYAYLPSGQLRSARTISSYTKHTYDSGGKLERTESFEAPPEMLPPYGYSYDQTAWIDPQKMKLVVLLHYQYNTLKRLESLTFKDEAFTILTLSKFSYNETGLIARQESLNQNGYIDYAYDATGNLKKKSQYMIKPDGATHLLSTNEYEFDGMHNPFLFFKNTLIPGTESNVNNVIKETFIRYDSISSNVVQNTVEQHVYEYNEHGYPVKMDNEYTFEYH